ncbi:UNVERIFIED_CONTAM: hypothetical protein NCL1_48892 [Trichonephila clavipes]
MVLIEGNKIHHDKSEHLGVGQGLSSSLHPISREDLWLDGYLECPHDAQVLYIYRHPRLDQNSNQTLRQSIQYHEPLYMMYFKFSKCTARNTALVNNIGIILSH